jgi:hypothetical protein
MAVDLEEAVEVLDLMLLVMLVEVEMAGFLLVEEVVVDKEDVERAALVAEVAMAL